MIDSNSAYICPFGLGQKVFIISRDSEKVWVECESCDGIGSTEIYYKDNRINMVCSKCYGKKGEREYRMKKWNMQKDECASRIGLLYTIGRIMLDHCSEDGIEWKAMCKETGIGSGTIYNMKDMFYSKEDALNECKIRNEENDRS